MCVGQPAPSEDASHSEHTEGDGQEQTLRLVRIATAAPTGQSRQSRDKMLGTRFNRGNRRIRDSSILPHVTKVAGTTRRLADVVSGASLSHRRARGARPHAALIGGARRRRTGVTSRVSSLRTGPRGVIAHAALVAAALTLVAVGLSLSYPRPWNKAPVFTDPRQGVTYDLSNQWADTGRPERLLPAWDRLPADIRDALAPRDAAVRDGSVVPKDFPLTVVLFAAVDLVSPRLVLYLVPLAGALTLLLCGLVTFEITRSRAAAWLAAAVLGSSQSFWPSSASIVATDTVGAGLLLLAVYALLRAGRSAAWCWFAMAGAALALVGAARYTSLGFGVAIWLGFLACDRIRWRLYLLTLGVAALCFSPILIYNQWIYGSPISTGYGLGDRVTRDTLQGTGILRVDVRMISNQVGSYLLRPEMAGLLLGAFAGMVVALRQRRGLVRIALPVLASLAGVVVYYGGRVSWGSSNFVVNASFPRYMLPAVAMACVFWGFLWHSGNTYARAALGVAVVALGAVSLHTVVTGPAGVAATRRAVVQHEVQRALVLANTPPDALIITKHGSKVFWPARQTLTATFLVRDSGDVAAMDTAVWNVVPSTQRLADVAVRLVEQGEDVYIDNLDRWLSAAQLKAIAEDLQRRGVELNATGQSAWLLSAHLTDIAPPAGT